MIDYEVLWEYQNADLDLNRFERKLQQSDTRKELLSIRDVLLDQQKRVKQVEVEISAGQGETARIQEEIKKVMDRFRVLEEQLEGVGAEDLSMIRRTIRELDAFKKGLLGLNKELSDINKMAYGVEKILKDAYVAIQRDKAKFDDLKAKHDEELQGSKGALEQLQAAVAEKEKKVEPELLAKYRQVKRNRVNPLAKVVDGCCAGCNMTIPSGILRRLKEGEGGIIECESCGRILYYDNES